MAITQIGKTSPRIKVGNSCSTKRVAGYSEAVMPVSEPTELPIGSTAQELLDLSSNTHICQLIGLAYSTHRAKSKAKLDIPEDAYDRITILVSGGPWTQRMWLVGEDVDTTLTLTESGDYIMWDPGFRHEWTPPQDHDTVMLTLTIRKWPKQTMKKPNKNR